MNQNIATTMITKNGVFVGWKVYIDGKKYPKKPVNLYKGILEDAAIRLAFQEAGLNPDTVKDLIL